MAYFENGMDYISDSTITITDAVKEYNCCIQKDWYPMSLEDLKKTSGVTINQYTKLDVPSDNFYVSVTNFLKRTFDVVKNMTLNFYEILLDMCVDTNRNLSRFLKNNFYDNP